MENSQKQKYKVTIFSQRSASCTKGAWGGLFFKKIYGLTVTIKYPICCKHCCQFYGHFKTRFGQKMSNGWCEIIIPNLVKTKPQNIQLQKWQFYGLNQTLNYPIRIAHQFYGQIRTQNYPIRKQPKLNGNIQPNLKP